MEDIPLFDIIGKEGEAVGLLEGKRLGKIEGKRGGELR
jgi:hypothetical protein